MAFDIRATRSGKNSHLRGKRTVNSGVPQNYKGKFSFRNVGTGSYSTPPAPMTTKSGEHKV
jgi:hypothetical protein